MDTVVAKQVRARVEFPLELDQAETNPAGFRATSEASYLHIYCRWIPSLSCLLQAPTGSYIDSTVEAR